MTRFPLFALIALNICSLGAASAHADRRTYKVEASASVSWLTHKGMLTRNGCAPGSVECPDNDWTIQIVNRNTGAVLAKHSIKASNPDLRIQHVFTTEEDNVNIVLRLVERDLLRNDYYELDSAALSPADAQVRVGLECSQSGSHKVIDRVDQVNSSTFQVTENGQSRLVNSSSYTEISHIVNWRLVGSCYSMIVQRVN
jgi:hypothetical protein